MNFNFEVTNKFLKQKKSHHHHKPSDRFCSFTFTTSEWKHLDKYIIFWNRKGKSVIRFIGSDMRGQCPIPESVLNDLYFTIQVYANDRICTQKVKVYMHEEIDTDEFFSSQKMLNRFFEKMEHKIDNIIYDDNKLLIYIDNELIKTIDIVDEGLLRKIFGDEDAPQYIVDMALSEDSDLPVANKVIYQALEEKLDKNTLANVAFTGSYNDLTDVPNEFTPSQHQHNSNDIMDLDASLDDEVDDFIDELIENL